MESIYFDEPGGVLFEIETDSPGFTADEPCKRRGCDIKWPDQYESMRTVSKSRLEVLHQPVLSISMSSKE